MQTSKVFGKSFMISLFIKFPTLQLELSTFLAPWMSLWWNLAPYSGAPLSALIVFTSLVTVWLLPQD